MSKRVPSGRSGMLVSATSSQHEPASPSARAAGSLNFTTSCQLLNTMRSVASCRRAHLLAGSADPGHVLYAQLFVVDAGEEALLMQHRVLEPQPGELFDEARQALDGIVRLPV